jgi:DnaJ family protein C protein 7
MDIEYNSHAQKYKELGNQAYKAQDYSKAITHYTKAIEIDPQDPNFFTNRALCYYNLNRYEECVKDCDRALRINTNLPKALKKKAQALANLMRFDEAVDSAKAANAIEKSTTSNNELEEIESYKSNFDRFVSAEKSNDYSEALSCISYLVTKLPNTKALKLYKVECLAKLGQTNEASQLLSSMHNENTPDFFYLKGIIELYNGDSVKAKKYFADGIRLDPENVKCQKALHKAKRCEVYKDEGNELIKQNKYKEAEAKYTEALNLDPYNKKLNSIIYSNRALTYMKRGEKLKALQDLNNSLELDPNYMKSLVRRAELNMEREDYTAALNDYSKIQELDPKINLKAKIDEARKKEKLAKKKDYYAILGVPKTATDAEIKKAYKTLALKHHPDRNRGKSDVEQDEASNKFKDIAEAHGVLTDPEKKKMYDCGSMQYDGDQGAGYEDMGEGGQFNMGNMGNMGSNTKFSFNGSDMGGAGIDPSQIFQMFFGGGGDGFEGMGPGMSGMRGGNKGNSNARGSSKSKGFKGGFPGFGNFGGYNHSQGPNGFANFM